MRVGFSALLLIASDDAWKVSFDCSAFSGDSAVAAPGKATWIADGFKWMPLLCKFQFVFVLGKLRL